MTQGRQRLVWPASVVALVALVASGLSHVPWRLWVAPILPAHDTDPVMPGAELRTVETAPRPMPLSSGAGPDRRLAAMPAAEVAIEMARVEPRGFTGLVADPWTVAEGARNGAMERAALALPPLGAANRNRAVTADFASAHQAIALYRKGNVAAGDEFAKTIADPLLRTTAEWVALRYDPREAGLARLQAFADRHTDWPTRPWIGRRIEEMNVAALHDPARVEALFGDATPTTLYGRLSLARAEIAAGDLIDGVARVRRVWRREELSAGEEADILKEFGPLLGPADHKFRADRLLYKEQVAPALRAAALAGPDVRLLAQARARIIAQGPTPAMNAALAAVPKPLAADPGLLFARIQKARRADDIAGAAAMMAQAPTDPDLVINGDEWWVERRLVARKLLDAGDAPAAYRICAGHAAASDAMTIEAEFHAGWIALRFLGEPVVAATHFAKAAGVAETPISRARVAYWQGRAAEAAGDQAAATAFFGVAAGQPISFYGQLAGARLGHDAIALRRPASIATGDDRSEAVRVVEQLYGLGERDIALPLALEIGRVEPADAQVAALADVLAGAGDARATLLVGKYGTQRGLAVDETAFPTFGIPGYEPLGNSADRAVVFAIARQESEFDPRSVSAAGAKGLMQIIDATARTTATKLGVGFDETRLLNDAAFNAQIGAAHLGQLLAEQRGSYILTFAAYNAGSGRVKDWIAAYGDPRKPGVDPVDWIERIPFTETRNYVQRVFENLQVYRARFGETGLLVVDAGFAPRKGT